MDPMAGVGGGRGRLGLTTNPPTSRLGLKLRRGRTETETKSMRGLGASAAGKTLFQSVDFLYVVSDGLSVCLQLTGAERVGDW